MARIPGPDGLGDVVARPQRYNETQTPRAAFGGGIGEAIEQVGAAVQRDEQRAAAEAEHARKVEEHKAQVLREKADQGAALDALHTAENDLAAMRDEVDEGVRTGKIDKKVASQEWATRAKDRITSALEKVPEAHKQAVQRGLTDHFATHGRAINKAVTLRDQSDIRASIDQVLEATQRQYTTDPKGATQRAMVALQELGPASGLQPEQLQKIAQGWKENAQFTAGYEAVSAARNNRKGLDAAEQTIGALPDLDPQKRAHLMDRVAAYRITLDQKAEIAAARGQREAERRLKFAEAEFSTFQALADKGPVNQEYVDRVMQATAGTPYQGGVKHIMQATAGNGALAAMPIAQLRAGLDQLDARLAKEGRTPELDKRRDQVAKVLRGSETDLKNDPLRAGLERGVITEISPVDVSSPQGIQASIASRAIQAQRVSVWAGQPVSPLTEQEATSVKSMLDLLPTKERSTAVATIAKALGPQMSAGLAKQMDGKDEALALAFGMAGSSTSNGRLVSELVLKGAAAKKDGTSTKGGKAPELKASQWKANIAAQLEDVYPVQTLSDKTRDAALLIAHGFAAEQGGSLSESDLRRAVDFAVGGSIVEHNGKRLPVPPGIDQSALEQRLRAVSVSDIAVQTNVLPAGLVAPGNVDLSKRPRVQNADGSVSTLQSMSIGVDGREVLIPTIVDGKKVSDEQAIEHFRRTKQHLGVFVDAESASAYAKTLSDQMGSPADLSKGTVRAAGVQVPVADFVKALPGAELMYAGPNQYAVMVGGRPVTSADGKRRIIVKVQ